MRRALGALSALIPVGIVATGPDGGSWYHNQRWEDLSGFPGRAMRGQPWYRAVHPDDVEQVGEEWRAQLPLRGLVGRFRVRSATGHVHQCVAETVPMLATDGTLANYIIVIRDADQPPVTQGLTNELMLDSLMNRSQDIITVLNPDGTWRWSSSGAIRLVGHQVDYDPAQGITPFIHPDERAAVVEQLARLVAGGGGPDERFEYRVRAADGSWRIMESLIDVRIDDPTVRGLVVHARDITDRRRTLQELEVSNRRLVNLITAMSTAIVLEDEEGSVLVANRAFVELYRLPVDPDDLVGRKLAEHGLSVDTSVLDPPDAGRRMARMIGAGQPAIGNRVTMRDGRILEVDFIPMYGGEHYLGQLWLSRDVTNQARAAAEQRRLLASERAEHRRTAELEAYRTEYLASVSHELRTPLTSILGYTQMLRELLQRRGADEELQYTRTIERNVDRLFRLAGDLLLLDSLESGAVPLHLGQVDIAQLARHSAHAVAPQATARSVSLAVDITDGPPLRGDHDRLGQLLDNLLSNAVKFTEAGGRVRLALAPVTAGPGAWRIEICDTGIGIPEEDQSMLFSRFFRGSNARTRGIPGRGLGLSIAHVVTELHHGVISVDSEVGSGTTITVVLDDASEPEGAPAAE